MSILIWKFYGKTELSLPLLGKFPLTLAGIYSKFRTPMKIYNNPIVCTSGGITQ